MMTVLAEAAGVYADAGWPIFPLTAGAKHPMKGSAGCLDATCDPDQVAWWWEQHPEANIGAATGRCFDVVDLDGAAACDLFDRWCGLNGFDDHSVDAGGELRWPGPVCATGNGLHLYLGVTGHGNRAGISGGDSGIDFRGHGGYVVLPPSIHPGGGRYRWVYGPPFGDELIAAPVWLDALLGRRQSPAVAPAHTHLAPVRSDRADRGPSSYARAGLDREAAALRAAPKGARNDTLNRSAFNVGQLVAAGWLVAGEAERELLAAALAAGLGEVEARRTMKSGFEAGAKHPRAARTVR